MPIPFIAPLLLKLPWLRAYGKWLLLASVIGGLVWFGMYFRGLQVDAHGKKAAEKALVAEKAARAADHNDALTTLLAEQARAAKYASDYASMQEKYDRLAIAAAKGPLTVHREEAPNVQTGLCTVTTRSEPYRLCRNAAWSLDPAAIAACEAGTSNATSSRVVPAAPVLQPPRP